MNPKIVICTLLVVAFAWVWAGCNRGQKTEEVEKVQDEAAELPAKYKSQGPVPKPDFAEAAKDPKFQSAIAEGSKLFGAKAKPLTAPGEGERVPGGVRFDVPGKKIETILLEAHTNFLAKGFYLFRCEQHFGIGDKPDTVALLPTDDKYAVMAAMDTNGDNYELGTAGVIAWMKELEQEQPYVLTGIGFDYMEGMFTSPVKDPAGLAKRMYQFCPDIVDQGVGSVQDLAKELKKGKLYFWWD